MTSPPTSAPSRTGSWRPTTYRLDGTTVRASRDRRELAIHSRIMADLAGDFYSRAIPRWVAGDLIDLGCGSAPLLGAYAPLCSSVVLADWANSAHENPDLHMIIDLNGPLTQLDHGAYDVVLLSDVLEHVAEPMALMAEISRILKPGGRLILNVPFTYWIHEAPHDYYRYTRYALERFVEQAGLVVVELDALGGWVEVLADLLSKLLSRAGLGGVARIAHRVVIPLSRSAVGSRLAAKGGETLPLGYGLVAQKPPSRSAVKGLEVS